MKLDDLDTVNDLAKRRERADKLLEQAVIFPDRLYANMCHFDGMDKTANIVGIVGGEWLGQAIVARCKELIADYDRQLKDYGIEP